MASIFVQLRKSLSVRNTAYLGSNAFGFITSVPVFCALQHCSYCMGEMADFLWHWHDICPGLNSHPAQGTEMMKTGA